MQSRVRANIKYRKSKPQARLIEGARRRAKDYGREFKLKVADIFVPNVCPVLGHALHVAPGSKRATINSPSLDRINNKEGYTKDNIIVVSARVNELKRDAEMWEMAKITAFYMRLLAKVTVTNLRVVEYIG